MSLFSTLAPSLSRNQSALTDRDQATAATTVRPRYEIKESAEAFGLEVWLPGVAKNGLELTVHEGELLIVGRRAWQKPAGWTQLYRETPPADFSLTLEHDNTFDAAKIVAELRDGVLRVTLPKAESIKPRKIAVA